MSEQGPQEEDTMDRNPHTINPQGSAEAALLKYGAFMSQAKVVELQGTPYITIPKDYDLVPMTQFLKNPLRPKADMTFHYWDDFVKYAEKFKQANTLAFWMENCIIVIFDYHTEPRGDIAVKADWLEHRIRFYAKDAEDVKKYVTRFRDKNVCDIYGCSTTQPQGKAAE